MPAYKIIETCYWGNDGTCKKDYYIRVRKSFWVFSWWSYVTKRCYPGVDIRQSFDSLEEARKWLKGREDWVKTYGNTDVVSTVVEDI